MYRSIGAGPDGVGDESWQEWEQSALAALAPLARPSPPPDMAVFVVDRPAGPDAPGPPAGSPSPGGPLVAAGAGTVANRLPNPWRPTDARVGYVQWMSTDADFRRRGLGGAILRALLDWYEAAGVAVVELHATPDGASLYATEGFSDNRGGKAMRRRVWDVPGPPRGLQGAP